MVDVVSHRPHRTEPGQAIQTPGRDTLRAMPQENVEIVGRSIEAYNRGDLDAFLADLHPRVVWEENHPLFRFVGLDPVQPFDGANWAAFEPDVPEATPKSGFLGRPTAVG